MKEQNKVEDTNKLIAEFMPILGSVRFRLKSDLDKFPMAMLHEDHAHHIHGQSLRRLAKRGRMGYDEIICNVKKPPYNELSKLDEATCLVACKQLIEWHNNQPKEATK